MGWGGRNGEGTERKGKGGGTGWGGGGREGRGGGKCGLFHCSAAVGTERCPPKKLDSLPPPPKAERCGLPRGAEVGRYCPPLHNWDPPLHVSPPPHTPGHLCVVVPPQYGDHHPFPCPPPPLHHCTPLHVSPHTPWGDPSLPPPPPRRDPSVTPLPNWGSPPLHHGFPPIYPPIRTPLCCRPPPNKRDEKRLCGKGGGGGDCFARGLHEGFARGGVVCRVGFAHTVDMGGCAWGLCTAFSTLGGALHEERAPGDCLHGEVTMALQNVFAWGWCGWALHERFARGELRTAWFCTSVLHEGCARLALHKDCALVLRRVVLHGEGWCFMTVVHHRLCTSVLHWGCTSRMHT